MQACRVRRNGISFVRHMMLLGGAGGQGGRMDTTYVVLKTKGDRVRVRVRGHSPTCFNLAH